MDFYLKLDSTAGLFTYETETQNQTVTQNFRRFRVQQVGEAFYRNPVHQVVGNGGGGAF